MDEEAIREAVRWLMIREQVVEHDLTLTFVSALIRQAYGEGYTHALTDPWANLEETAKTTAALYCRLPV